MTVSPSLIVKEARTWIGTPYVHQMAARGAGTDCLGLVRGVWRALFGSEPELPPAYSMDWSEPQGEEQLWGAASRHLLPKQLNTVAVGDVILFRMREGSIAKHLGIQAGIGAAPSFVHAYSGHGVVESPMSEPWARRVVARFQFPDVEAD
ncbi:NlpC/P60 family protein [uncultured Tateyamaria sp.]|uniref:NlpC/P60 family protein n=1 Tax=uncultured Tateyamaria sp. TaxID=455651 RepID=UPI002611FF59|nr:NlpC/P60 family protein [uncultured Tateyamaria sp.]